MVKRCPRDSSELLRSPLDAFYVDFCPTCRGMFVDSTCAEGMIQSVTFYQQWKKQKENTVQEKAIGLQTSCPHCEVSMREIRLKNADLKVEICDTCSGLWLDHGELSFMQERLGPETSEKTKLDYKAFVSWVKSKT